MFYQTDKLLVLPIYAAGEAPIEGVEGHRLYEGILAHGHKDVVYVASLDAARQVLIDILKPGDIFLTLGAGDVWRLGEALVADLSPT